MLLLTPCLSALFLLPGVLGGEIPIIDGALGSVPASTPRNLKIRAASTSITPGKLRVVENSGVCETTPGVYQASGYGDLTRNQSVWFWFFAARENPHTAPLALWFNGGPGSSSMIGLFQENGPCRITNDSLTVVPNPMSWNNKANILYIDQPVGTGFSHGDTLVQTSQQAANDVWAFLQIFFSDSRFSKYSRNPLAIWTESYGGHYGPTFAAHFLRQNAAIEAGFIEGKPLELKVLGIGNGLTDPLAQVAGYIAYAQNNAYRPLVNQSQLAAANSTLPECKKKILACYNGVSDSACSDAQAYCNDNIFGKLLGDWDVYDVRTPANSSYPPDFSNYIDSIRSRIGAEVPFSFVSLDVYTNFAQNGDWMRNSSPDLEFVINSGIRTLIYAGDADFIVNYIGVEAMVDNLRTKFTSKYEKEKWKTYKVAGQPAGQYKRAGAFAYLRVYGAGHEVPAYAYGNLQPGQAALQFFNQITFNQPLHSI